MAKVVTRFTRRRAAVPAVILVGLLLCAGIAVALTGGNDLSEDDLLVGPSYYANPAAVCGLLDPQDLEVALGRAYGKGFEPPLDYPVFTGMTGIVRCTYPAKQAQETFSLGVVYAYADQVYDDRVERNARSGEVREVSGLGERAVWSDVPKELMVSTGDKLVAVHLAASGESEERHIERLRRLAEKAIERLR